LSVPRRRAAQGRDATKPFLGDPLEVYDHDVAVARRLLVMAHWRKTPREMRDIPPEDLELMEFSFLLLERRQSETLDHLLGSTLGTSWDAGALMGRHEEEKAKRSKKRFDWSLRKKPPRVHLPLTTVVTQDPKFNQHLKEMASKAMNQARENPSIVDAPKWVDKRDEVVDLSYVPKDVFLKYAGALPS